MKTACSKIGHIHVDRDAGEVCGLQGRNSGQNWFNCQGILRECGQTDGDGAGAARSTAAPGNATHTTTPAPDPSPPAAPPGWEEAERDANRAGEHVLTLLDRVKDLMGTLAGNGTLGEMEGKEAHDIMMAIQRIEEESKA